MEFLIILGLLAFAMAFLCINILVKKDGKFRSEDVGKSRAMRERGISCYQAQERKEHNDKRSIKEMMK